MMKTGHQPKTGIVQPAGVERDRASRGAAAKKVDRAAFAHALNRRFPHFRFSDGLDNGVEGGSVSGLSNRLGRGGFGSDFDNLARTEPLGGCQPPLPPPGNRDLATEMFGQD